MRAANVSAVRMLMGRWGASVEASASDFLDLLQPGRRKQRGSETTAGSSGAAASGGGGAPPSKRLRQGSAGGGQAGGRVPDHQLTVALKLLSSALLYGQGETLLQHEEAGAFGVGWSRLVGPGPWGMGRLVREGWGGVGLGRLALRPCGGWVLLHAITLWMDLWIDLSMDLLVLV